MDPHDLRMDVGQAAMAFGDAIDDEVIEQYEALAIATRDVYNHLTAKGVHPDTIVGSITAIVVSNLIHFRVEESQS